MAACSRGAGRPVGTCRCTEDELTIIATDPIRNERAVVHDIQGAACRRVAADFGARIDICRTDLRETDTQCVDADVAGPGRAEAAVVQRTGHWVARP